MICLDLCCGWNKHKGNSLYEVMGVDRILTAHTDVVCDLEMDWPFKTESIDSIIAQDAVEHLHNPIHTMNEIWRVLKSNGEIFISVPSTDGRGAFQDPTHVSYWNYNSFFYYSVNHQKYFMLARKQYGFHGAFKILSLENKKGLYEVNWTEAHLRKEGKWQSQ